MAGTNPYADNNGNALTGKETEFKLWNKEKKLEKYVTELEEHIKCCKEAADYSISRFDVLIISLSSGALGFSISFIKDVAKGKKIDILWQLKTSWILFGASLITNLLSQATSFYAHKMEIKISNELIKQASKKGEFLTQRKLESKKKALDYGTNTLNVISLFSFILGVIFLVIFTFCNF